MTNSLLENQIISDHLDYCNAILPHVSRSFALGINTLKGALRKNILVGYLLCRIADTIEDDLNLSSEKKCFYLQTFSDCFQNKNKTQEISKIASELKGDPYHVQLVQNTPSIFEVFATLTLPSQAILTKWVKEMCTGMIQFVEKYPLGIRISSLAEYKEYCYYVAGTVGYMLTDLWKEYGYFINSSRHSQLTKLAGIFGEALQTINILKDIAWDVLHENSIFIPTQNMSETSVLEIVRLAEHDLQESLQYIASIPRINQSIRFFCIFPLFLAQATLREIKKSPSILNPIQKIKVSRKEALAIYKNSYIASFSNFWLFKTAKALV